jgi:hypothetical protein
LPVHSLKEFLAALFLPKAHGNMRPWSENGYFMLLSWLFGIDPLPFRIVVFVTVIADLFLIAAVVRRLTGSAWAAFWSQIIWLANSCVAVAFCWTSVYNLSQSLFFLLLAFWLLLQYFDTGRQGYFVAQWIVFALGLGSLETNVVYPAVATLYALLFERRHIAKILPMFAASALFTAAHLWAAPIDKSGAYALHFDFSVFPTLWAYFRLALGPERLAHFFQLPAWAVSAATAVLCVAAVAAAVSLKRLGLFAAGWFVLLLSPLLPLRDHISDYYLTVPVFGLALLGGAAMAAKRRWIASIAVALYLAVSLPAAWMVTSWHYARSQSVKRLVLGVVAIHENEPGKAILLTGVNTDLFLAGMADLPFELYGIRDVYLVPGSEDEIHDSGRFAHYFVLPKDKTRELLDAGKAVVYDAAGSALRNVTTLYRQTRL